MGWLGWLRLMRWLRWLRWEAHVGMQRQRAGSKPSLFRRANSASAEEERLRIYRCRPGTFASQEAADLGVRPVDARGFGGGFLAGQWRRVSRRARAGRPPRRRRQNFSHLRVRERGQDAGDDRHGDARRAAALAKLEKRRVVEKKLGGDEVRARVHFGLQVAQVGLGRGRLGMRLGVAADAEAEFGIMRADEGDQFAGVAQAVGVGLECRRALRRVAAQGHEVAKARVAQTR